MKSGSFLVAVPAIIWIGSYLYLAFYYKRWNIFKVRIHESGHYTFIGTVFYFNHFLRELLPDTFFALTMYWTYHVTHANQPGGEADGYFTRILTALIIFLVGTFIGSVRSVGLRNTLLDLFQFREVDVVVEFGSHWQMHFLSTLTIMLLIILPAFTTEVQEYNLVVILFLAFFAVSILFRTGLKAVQDSRWILHGGREILTFFPLMVLPSYAFNLSIQDVRLNLWSALAIIALVILLLCYLRVYLRSDVRELARGDFEVRYLIASHFFEHVLDVVYIFLLVALLINI